jgi:hypothetical protein
VNPWLFGLLIFALVGGLVFKVLQDLERNKRR